VLMGNSHSGSVFGIGKADETPREVVPQAGHGAPSDVWSVGATFLWRWTSPDLCPVSRPSEPIWGFADQSAVSGISGPAPFNVCITGWTSPDICLLCFMKRFYFSFRCVRTSMFFFDFRCVITTCFLLSLVLQLFLITLHSQLLLFFLQKKYPIHID